MEMETKTPVTYDNVLAILTAHAASATDANFKALAAGSMAYLVGYSWADKEARKPSKEIQASIVAAFKDIGGKSKRYEFAGLCLIIARALSKGHAWGNELRQQDSVESGVAFLAARFGSVAGSVSELASKFGTQRSGGNRKSKAFPDALASLIDKAQQEGESIPVGPSMVQLLTVGQPSNDDASFIINRLVTGFNSEQIATLIGHLNDVLTLRMAQETAPVEEKIAA